MTFIQEKKSDEDLKDPDIQGDGNYKERVEDDFNDQSEALG
jgi:hypothetical protein